MDQNLVLCKKISVQSLPRKIICIGNDELLIGENQGYLDVISANKKNSVFKGKLGTHYEIKDMIKTHTMREYAFALEGKGIGFFRLIKAKMEG